MHGNRTTTPNGTDMLELPFNLRGLLKKASRDVNLLSGGLFSPEVGS